MDNKEKIERLKKEIEELKHKKEEKDEVGDLLSERNQLKYSKMYSFGKTMKNMGSKIVDWAEEKENQQEDMKNQKKSKEKGSMDVYDALFGESDLDLV